MCINKKWITLLLFVITSFVLCFPTGAFASTKVVDTGFLEEQGVQYRHLKTVETKWTGYKYVTTKYYLTKGDQIFYSEGSGNNTTVTVAVGYGVVAVSVSVPLGKKGGKSEGVAKTE